MGARWERGRAGYIASPLATRDRAIALALQLYRMDFTPNAIAFELCHHHGFGEVEATRIVREAAVRARRADGDAAAPSPAAGARDGRRWMDLGGAGRSSNPIPRSRYVERS